MLSDVTYTLGISINIIRAILLLLCVMVKAVFASVH